MNVNLFFNNDENMFYKLINQGHMNGSYICFNMIWFYHLNVNSPNE